MRKIFIDGGAHTGESLEAFCRIYEDSEEYEAYCFEASYVEKFKSSFDKVSKRHLEQNKIKSVEWYNKAVWIEDGEITFYNDGKEGSSLIKEKWSLDPKEVECFDLGSWIKNNFSNEDYIVLKLDIEGAEYEVLDKMFHDKTINYVNKLYCEIHGLKCGKTFQESVDLVVQAEKFDHKLYYWTATEVDKENMNLYYTHESLSKEYKQWNLRRVAKIVEFEKTFMDGKMLYSATRKYDDQVIEEMLIAKKKISNEKVHFLLQGDRLIFLVEYEILDVNDEGGVHWGKRIKEMKLENSNFLELIKECKGYDQ